MKKIVIARGEATGHEHAIVSDEVELIEAAERILNVRNPMGVPLTHQEHDVVIIPQKEGYTIGTVEEINWPLHTIQKIQD